MKITVRIPNFKTQTIQSQCAMLKIQNGNNFGNHNNFYSNIWLSHRKMKFFAVYIWVHRHEYIFCVLERGDRRIVVFFKRCSSKTARDSFFTWINSAASYVEILQVFFGGREQGGKKRLHSLKKKNTIFKLILGRVVGIL